MSARVLVVDDIPANVKVLEAKLLAEYYDVLTANDGREALETVKAQAPDIVLLDVMMPGLDGFEVCKRIKEDPATSHIPVVMVTALSDVKDRVRGLEAGADDFLTKPVNTVALFARIRSLVRLKRACDEWFAREAAAMQLGALVTRDEDIEVEPGAPVLLVQDQKPHGNVVAETLAAQGYDVVEAHSLDDAANLGPARDFELILVDHMVGNQDSLRFCSQLRSREASRHTPVLLLIDDGEIDRLAKALELGVNDYLVKPVDRDELIARSRTQLRRKLFEDRLRATYHENLAAAMTDSLTGLYNRRYLETHYGLLCERARETAKPVSLMLIDIDRFKSINDRYGHAVGDEALKEISRQIRDKLRGFDTVVRLGGEEFVVVMPDSSLNEATIAAKRLCRSISDASFVPDGVEEDLALAVSIGVASTASGEARLDDLLGEADTALYEAKEAGRNRVVAAPARNNGSDVAVKAAG